MSLVRFPIISAALILLLLAPSIGLANVPSKAPSSRTGGSSVVGNIGPLQGGRVVRVTSASGAPGSPVSVTIQLDSQGNENALSFSIVFDPTLLSFVSATRGSDAASAQFITNSGQSAQGRVGLSLAVDPGSAFTAGIRNLATVNFTIAGAASAQNATVDFGDQPFKKAISDPNVNPLTATFSAGTISIVQPCPTISGIAPSSGIIGSGVTVNGENFTGITSVKFTSNILAQFSINSATQIVATVPNGAATGPITVGKTGCSDAQTGTFTINGSKQNQTITFSPLPSKTFGDPPFTVNATASSGLAVTFTIASGPATVSGNLVTITGAGTVTVQADQPGDASFNSAPSFPQSFQVAKGAALLILNTPTQIVNGNPKTATVTTSPPGLTGVTITYNGSTTPPTTAGSYAVSASLNNPNYTGNTATGTLRLVSFSPTNSQTVNPGTSQTASVLPSGGNPGISGNLNHTSGGVAAGITVGVFSGNPTDRGLLNVGGGFTDVMVTNSNAGDTAVVNYYYPSTVTGNNESQLRLFYFVGFNWALVKDGNGNLPTINTTDNLDGTTSGGKFTVTLSSTSQPKISALTGTFFTASTAIVGDCDLSGIVNITDLIFMANILAGNTTPTATQKDACDVLNDGKGNITISDLFTLANFLAGNIQTLPVNTGAMASPGDIVPEAFLSIKYGHVSAHHVEGAFVNGPDQKRIRSKYSLQEWLRLTACTKARGST